MFTWLKRIAERSVRRRAEDAPMQRYRVSRAYVQAVIENTDAWMCGEISREEWECEALRIADAYPQDSRMTEENEGERDAEHTARPGVG
ncbi:MAG: hypothetical protein H0W02_18800 [Ktedonobacteraceae bacterium]|nr:hypothetical protein [Ktedonobacteraceae bacterium]